jgi:hypothetical protein
MRHYAHLAFSRQWFLIERVSPEQATRCALSASANQGDERFRKRGAITECRFRNGAFNVYASPTQALANEIKVAHHT